MQKQQSAPARWIRTVADFACIVLVVHGGKDRDRRAVLCAVRLDGADAADRRRTAGDEISLRLQHRLAARFRRLPRHAARISARCRSAAMSSCSAGRATARRSGSSA